MGRLIDADKFKGKVIASHTGSGVIKLIAIDEVPTAYDPDKVVEQLKKKRADALRMLRENKGTALEYASKCRYDIWNEAVEIVKGGVVGG